MTQFLAVFFLPRPKRNANEGRKERRNEGMKKGLNVEWMNDWMSNEGPKKRCNQWRSCKDLWVQSCQSFIVQRFCLNIYLSLQFMYLLLTRLHTHLIHYLPLHDLRNLRIYKAKQKTTCRSHWADEKLKMWIFNK